MTSESGARLPLLKLIPTFEGKSGEKVQHFITQFEDVAKLTKWSDAEKILVLKSKVKGRAMQRLLNNTELFAHTNWDKFLKEFLNHFKENKTATQLGQEFQAIKHVPNMTVRDLAAKINTSARDYLQIEGEQDEAALKMLDKIMLTKFLDSLKSNLAVEVRKQFPIDFQEAIEKAEALEKILEEDISTCAAISDIEQGHNILLEAKIIELTQQVNALKQEEQRPNKDNKKNSLGTYCLACGKDNHLLKDCFIFRRWENRDRSRSLEEQNNYVNSFRHLPYQREDSNQQYFHRQGRSRYRYRSNNYRNRGGNSYNRTNESNLNGNRGSTSKM